MQKALRVLLCGGGSGGHVVPNLAIATAVKKRRPNTQFLYVGSHLPLDAEIVKKENLPFKAVHTGKIRRYFSLWNLVAPFAVIWGIFEAFAILLQFKPNVIFSKGGYVSFPVVIAAWILRKPVLMHESDRAMGLANRVAAKFAKQNLVAFEDVCPQPKRMVHTGNPIRDSIFGGDPDKGYKLTGFIKDKPVLLVWGGSLGAVQVNDLLRSNFERLKDHFQVVHITGKGKIVPLKDASYKSFEYIDEDLKHIYAITDVVVGRAGANSLFELAAMRIPNLCIPLRQNEDQKLNAEYFENRQATVVLRDEAEFATTLEALWNNETMRANMKAGLKSIAKMDANQVISDLILDYENRN